jgi:hypothetical protein
MKRSHQLNRGCLTLIPPLVITLAGLLTAIAVIQHSFFAGYLVMMIFLLFGLLVIAGGVMMFWSLLKSQKSIFLCALFAVLGSFVPMVLFGVFLIGYTLSNHQTIEQVWGKTPLYSHSKGVELALNLIHATGTDHHETLKESNNQLAKLLIENNDLQNISMKRQQTLSTNVSNTNEAVEMLRIVQLLSIKANYHQYIACQEGQHYFTMINKQDFQHATDDLDTLIRELKTQNYLGDLGIDEASQPDGNVWVILDHFKKISDASHLELSASFRPQRSEIYSILQTAIKNRTFAFNCQSDVLDYEAKQQDGFKAIFLKSPDKLIVHFWGTEFLSPEDPISNFKLGRDPQWQNHRREVISKIKDYTSNNPNKPIYLIGYSLGGGLAQYAAYETVRLQDDDIGEIRVYTYCGIGVMDEIVNLEDADGKPLGPYDQTLANELIMMHVTTIGDIVSLIGGGHLKGRNTQLILLGDPQHEAFFLYAHGIKNLISFIDKDHFVSEKIFEFPLNWYLQTKRIQSEAGHMLSYLLKSGKASDGELWFRIVMSISLSLGKSNMAQSSRDELTELRKWFIYNAIASGKEDLYGVLTRIDWHHLRERALLALDEQKADALIRHIYLEVLKGKSEHLQELQALNNRMTNSISNLMDHPIASVGEFILITQQYFQLFLSTMGS